MGRLDFRAWASAFSCALAVLTLVSVHKTECKPGTFQYVFPLPVNPPLVLHPSLRSSSSFGVPYWVPHITGVPGYPFPFYLPGNIHYRLVPQFNFGPLFENQGTELLKDDTEDEEKPAQEEGSIWGVQRAAGDDQCGISSAWLRAEDDQETPMFRGQEPGSGGPKKGVVLVESFDYFAPDLTETAFHKHKGQSLLVPQKITYGIPTRNKESPWQVAMFVNGKFHCGASIIGKKHILTAAHCVRSYKNKPEKLKLSVGDWDLKSTDDGVNLEVTLKKITPHKNFNFFNLQNDIAVLELKEELTFNDRIRSVCLPPADLDVKGEPMTVTGWGRNEKNLLQTTLHKLTAVVVDNSICADRWSLSGAPRSLIGSGTICMDTQFGDSCKGDSGGPAIKEYPENSGIYVQVGIVSFGSGSCTDASLPGVYTRVAAFRDWIDAQMKS